MGRENNSTSEHFARIFLTKYVKADGSRWFRESARADSWERDLGKLSVVGNARASETKMLYWKLNIFTFRDTMYSTTKMLSNKRSNLKSDILRFRGVSYEPAKNK